MQMEDGAKSKMLALFRVSLARLHISSFRFAASWEAFWKGSIGAPRSPLWIGAEVLPASPTDAFLQARVAQGVSV